MIDSFGVQAAVSIVVQLLFFAITWWALQSINLDAILRKNRVIQARVLYILLTIAIGSIVGSFFLDYLLWSQQLQYIFQ